MLFCFTVGELEIGGDLENVIRVAKVGVKCCNSRLVQIVASSSHSCGGSTRGVLIVLLLDTQVIRAYANAIKYWYLHHIGASEQ